MQINQRVVVDGQKGRLIWKDNPWKQNDGTDADILVKVQTEKGTYFHRLSELTIDDEPIKEEPKMENKPHIEFAEFLKIEEKLEIRLGMIMEVEDVPKSDKLLKLIVNFGNENRIVVTNIKPIILAAGSTPQNLKYMRFAFITNLKPTKMMGIESTAMILPGQIDVSYAEMIALTGKPGSKLL